MLVDGWRAEPGHLVRRLISGLGTRPLQYSLESLCYLLSLLTNICKYLEFYLILRMAGRAWSHSMYFELQVSMTAGSHFAKLCQQVTHLLHCPSYIIEIVIKFSKLQVIKILTCFLYKMFIDIQFIIILHLIIFYSFNYELYMIFQLLLIDNKTIKQHPTIKVRFKIAP